MKLYGTDIEINTYDDDRLLSIAHLCNTNIELFKPSDLPYHIDVINGILSCMRVAGMIPFCFMHFDGHITVEST